MIKWETLEHNQNGSMQRARVPGGWLVKFAGSGYAGEGFGVGLTFYPDPYHEWDGTTLP